MTFINFTSQFNIGYQSWLSNTFSAPTFNFDFGNFWNLQPLPFNSNFPNDYKVESFSTPPFTFKVPVFKFTQNKFSSNKTYKSTNYQPYVSTHKYANLSRTDAITAAQSDSNLEKLSGGSGWSVNSDSFKNDIPYARKGTSAILAKVSKQIGKNLVITSALGTKTSPHTKAAGSASHYNENNPKLDIGGGLSHKEALQLQADLKATGYFSRVEVERDGDTSHLDIQIKESAFNNLNALA